MLAFLQDTWRDVQAYLPRPYDRRDKSATLAFKVGRLLSVLAIDLIGAGFLMILIYFITEKTGWVNLEEHAVADAFANMSTLGILALAVVAAPLFEELFFRFPLRYERNPFLGIARVLTPYRGTTAADGDAGQRLDARRGRLRAWWDRNYRWIFYLSAVLFAYVHLTNFKLTTSVLLLSPILVAAQFWMGALGGFLRARYGFIWTVLLHALHNLILVGGAVLGDGPTEKFAIDNEEYQLKIEEVSVISQEKDRNYRNNADTLLFANYPLSETLPLLLDQDYERVFFPPTAKDPKLNIEYIRKGGDLTANHLIRDALSETY
ncbi:MAG: CPBP family intramembrane glutamic endopeptidase, partial [Bacteroidota bacterium]